MIGRPTRSACQLRSTRRPRNKSRKGCTVEVEHISILLLVLSTGELVRPFAQEEVSSALRDVCELEASELDPEKKEGVTFLWNRVKFMEGNPRSVLDF